MKKFSEKTKEFIMTAAIVVTLLLPKTSVAQTKMDGFFSNYSDDTYSDRGNFSASGGFMNASNQTFGDAPLGGGLLVMLAAGAGYALLKKKED
ncbi:MAG: hypothetical protein IJK92_08775 [Bacteroidales bacterium]|nr:hypothetical protein [Bacteroidales bacterium]